MYINPYQDLNAGLWLKTNFHTHASTEPGSCGQHPIDMVLNLYRGFNYGAVCISNHDRYTDTNELTDDKLFLVQGVEYSQNEHMLTIGVNKSLHTLPHQEAIDETNKMGGFTILCHPNWIHKEFWPWKKIDELKGFAGIEVINMLIYRLSGSGLATDTWDYILKQGKLIFGFGNDDFHMPFDTGRSYNDIYVKERSFAGIKEAIDCGRFIASTGVSLEYLSVEDGKIKVKAKLPINTYIRDFTYKFISENGLKKEVYGETAECALESEKYIRVEIVAEHGATLYTQPVYKEKFFAK